MDHLHITFQINEELCIQWNTILRVVRLGIVIVLLIFTAAAPTAVAAAGAEENPNDGQEDAQAVTLGEEQTGRLTSGDVDWFKFTVESGKAITISGSTDEVGTTNFDLVDSNGNQLDGTSGGLSNESGEIGATSTYTGTYYLRVERRFTDRGGEYSFTVETTDTDAFEPNENQINATEITDEEEITGELTIGDVDWFNITAEQGETINVTGFAGANGTTNFQVHAKNGTIITGQDAISGKFARINATAPYTGQYSIEVGPRFDGKYGAVYNLTVDLPGEPSPNTNGTRAEETQEGGETDGGLPVVPLVAGIAIVVVSLFVGWLVRESEDESQ